MQKHVTYFGYGSNKDLEMMQAMIGRKEIKGEKGRLDGYELCAQNIDHIRDIVLPTAPVPKSPRQIIKESFEGQNFDLFVCRRNPKAHIMGTIWYITPEELEFVNNWELVDFGMYELAQVKIKNEAGKMVDCVTQVLEKEPIEIDQVLDGDNYDPYIFDKDMMLNRAVLVRNEYIELMKKLKQQ